MLPRCDTLIDVGCDHGRLCLLALNTGKARRVLATDISADSLAKAGRLLAPAYADRAELRLWDGLAGLDVSAMGDYAVAICGMGGELIASILERGCDAARRASRIVMQPMGGERELRAWLFANGYAATDENAILDAGRFYQLIAAKHAEAGVPSPVDDAFLEFGRIAFDKRQDALLALAQKAYKSRLRRMERANARGLTPETLARDLNAAKYIIDHWEDKK